MRALNRKLVRDVRHMWTQVLAIAAVIAAGIAVCISMLSALASLEVSRDDYYASARFADVFARVTRAPERVADRLREIPGIDVVETRVVADVTLDVPGLLEPATARLVSIPDAGPPLLNQLLLRQGVYPAAGRGDQVLISEAFASARHLDVGDRISAVINGRWRRLTVSGIALSPEYVYSIRPADLFPDDKRFGIFWMPRRDLAAAFDLAGAFNDVVVRLSADANADAVVAALDDVLARYGGLGAYTRATQTSAWFLENELGQLRNMGMVTPFIFAAVAAFLVNVVIARLVATQREQIGILKAFGYSRTAFALHYVGFVLAIVAIGATIGVAAGMWAGASWTRLYAAFFRFPSLKFVLPPVVTEAAVVIAALVAVLASLGAVARAAGLPPAEAMRPPSPAEYRPGLVDRIGLGRYLPLTTRMVARNLERRPLRAALSAIAIALSVAIVIVATFTVDAVHYLTDVQFNTAQRQDVTVSFTDTKSRRALHELQHLPGVVRAEPMRAIAVRLRAGNRSRRVAMIGLARDGALVRIIDEDLRPRPMPRDGLVLNDELARVLGVKRGDVVNVEVLEGARRRTPATVSDVVTEYLGLSAYMDIDAMNRLMREGSTLSGGYLQVDEQSMPALYAKLKQMPALAAVTVSNAARKSFEETVASVITTITVMFGLFGAAIAFGVIYNNSRIAFAERARDLGTLHVLGFSHGEMAQIVLGETAVLTAMGIPLGVLVGRLLGALVITLFSSELARIPLVIDPATNGRAVAITVAAAVLSALATWRQLQHLDVLSVLKAPE